MNIRFARTLQGEIDNRATARQAIDAIVAQNPPQPQLAFWRSYRTLETFTQPIYAPVALELGLEPSRFGTWVKSRSAALYHRIAPQSMVRTMASATHDYLEKLQAARAGIPADHLAFYDFVIAQEQVQVEAFDLAARQRYAEAASVLEAFMIAR